MIGKEIGGFRIISEIGRGGMGVVYRAQQLSLQREVALKTLLPRLAENRDLLERFRREAEAASRINHPNLVQIYDFGEAEGTCYTAMELVRGEPLAQMLNRSPRLDLRTIASICRQVAEALEALHGAQIVHRDIKPSNVLVAKDGRVKITDFGIAVLLGDGRQTRLTSTGMVMGTAEYMSPEMARGESVDGRSDIYSLGVLMYEALAGHPPFTAETPLGVALKHLNEPPPPVRRHRPDVPDALDSIVARCLEKAPKDRPQSAADVGKEIEQVELDLEFGRAGTTGLTSGIGAFHFATGELLAARETAEKEKTLLQRGIEALGRTVLNLPHGLREPFTREIAALAPVKLRHDEVLEQLVELRKSRRDLLNSAEAYRRRAEAARRDSARAFDEDRTEDVDELVRLEKRYAEQAVDLEKEARGMDSGVARLEETFREIKPEYDRLTEHLELKKAGWLRLRAEKARAHPLRSPMMVGSLTLLVLTVVIGALADWWILSREPVSFMPAPEPSRRPGRIRVTPPPPVRIAVMGELVPEGWKGQKERIIVATRDGDVEKEIVYYINTVGMKFVKIPAGEFMMGSESGKEDEKPVHRVEIETPFFMSAHEVQNLPLDGQPRENVTWYEAREFCANMTAQEGVTYRLPTEAEWEYACRAGSTTEYYWGDTPRLDCAWYFDGYSSPHGGNLVGTKLPNAWGLYDMSGNVQEWCSSLYRPYPYQRNDGREESIRRVARVLRGGTARYQADRIRSASRQQSNPSQRSAYVGFRVVVEP